MATMMVYIFDQVNWPDGTPVHYGIYTVVILAETEDQAWDFLLEKHPSEKLQWEFDTLPIKAGEVAVCIE